MKTAFRPWALSITIWWLCLSSAGGSDRPPVGVLRQLDIAGAKDVQAQASPIRAIALDSNGSLVVAAAGRTVTAFNVQTGQVAWRLTLGDPLRLLSALAVSPDGNQIAAGGDRGVYVVDMKSGALIETLGPDSWSVHGNTLVFSGDGKKLLAGSGQAVRLCDVATRRVEHEFALMERVRCVARSPDGRTLATAEQGDKAGTAVIRLWDPVKGFLFRTLKPGKGSVSALAFSPRGDMLASAGYSTSHGFRVTDDADLASPEHRDSLELWDISTGNLIRQFPFATDSTSALYRGSQLVKRKSRRDVHGILFTTDGRHLISAEADGRIGVFEVASGGLVRTLQSDRVAEWGMPHAISLSASGRVLATARGTAVTVWDIARLLHKN